MADKHSDEVQAWLRNTLGFDVRVDETVKFATGSFAGRPDMMMGLHRQCVYGENKTGTTSWNTRNWTDKQRQYAQRLEDDKDCEVYIFLMIGKDEPHLDRVKYEPRTLYIIPFKIALEAVERVSLYSKTIPFRAKHTRGRRAAISNLHLDCEHLFTDYALQWGGDGKWLFKSTRHPFLSYLGDIDAALIASELTNAA